jgi:hypothetical protein
LSGAILSTLKKAWSHIEHFGSLPNSSVFEVGKYLSSLFLFFISYTWEIFECTLIALILITL